jgi:hypothetical protein
MRAVAASRKSRMAVIACECTGSFTVVPSGRGIKQIRVGEPVLLTVVRNT